MGLLQIVLIDHDPDRDQQPAAIGDAAARIERDRQWQEDHRAWAMAHNQWVEANRLPLEDHRLF